jgi:hypothetical protein
MMMRIVYYCLFKRTPLLNTHTLTPAGIAPSRWKQLDSLAATASDSPVVASNLLASPMHETELNYMDGPPGRRRAGGAHARGRRVFTRAVCRSDYHFLAPDLQGSPYKITSGLHNNVALAQATACCARARPATPCTSSRTAPAPPPSSVRRPRCARLRYVWTYLALSFLNH